MVLIPASCTMSWTCIHSSSGTLSDLIPWIYLSLPLYNQGIWFRSYLNSLMVFSTFFNLSLNLAIRNSWSEPQSAPSLVFIHCIELLHLWLQRLPHIHGQRRSPSKTVAEVKSHLESNPIPTRDAQRAQTKSCAHQETPQRLSQTCLWMFVPPTEVWSAVDCHRGRGSGCSRPGYGISPLGGGHH